VVRRTEGDDLADLLGPAVELQVLPGDESALGVADEVDLGGTGGVADGVREVGELPGGVGDVGGSERSGEGGRRSAPVRRAGVAVVQGEDAVAVVGQRRGEAGPVGVGILPGAVDQDDWIRVLGGGVQFQSFAPAGDAVGSVMLCP
jgi:hypothetical protein